MTVHEVLDSIDYSNETPIPEFRDEYYFLSNFYLPAPVRMPKFHDDPTEDNLVYPGSEYAYVAAKTFDMDMRRYIQQAESPSLAKRLGYTFQIDKKWWNARRKLVMAKILAAKFENPYLCLKLLQTGNRPLIEGNNWNDRFWGQVDGEGKNWLGVLLMELREQFRIKIALDIKNPLTT